MKAIWNKENKEILANMYNQFKSDTEIAEVIGTSTYAVARQRCRVGLVKQKKMIKKSLGNANHKTIEANNKVIYFNKDGRDHYIALSPSLKNEEAFVRTIMDKQKLNNVVILKAAQIVRKGTLVVKHL